MKKKHPRDLINEIVFNIFIWIVCYLYICVYMHAGHILQ